MYSLYLEILKRRTALHYIKVILYGPYLEILERRTALDEVAYFALHFGHIQPSDCKLFFDLCRISRVL